MTIAENRAISEIQRSENGVRQMKVYIQDRCDNFYEVCDASTGEAISERFAFRSSAEDYAKRKGFEII